MADFDLNAFLAAQSAEGTSQGEGDFTISHEKAAQKMREYSLPREQAWVLKLVQAAVAWNCTQVILKQTRTLSTFHFLFESDQRLPTNEEVVTSILRADPESVDAHQNLGAALRILVEKLHLSFQLLIDTGAGEPQAIYAGVYFSELGEEKRLRQRHDWPKGLSLAIHHIPHTEINRLLLNYITIKQLGLPLMLELERFAYTCPAPFYIDGRRIDGVLRNGAQKWSPRKRPQRMAGIEIPGDEEPAAPICCGFDNQIFDLRIPIDEILRSNEPSPLAECYMMLAVEVESDTYTPIAAGRRSRIYWVRNGVIVDEEQLSPTTTFLQLTLYLPADGLKTDLTGFQLIRNDEYKARLRRVLERVTEVLRLEELAEREILPPLPPPPEREDEEEAPKPKLLEHDAITAFVDTTKRETAFRAPSLESYLRAVVYGAKAAIDELTKLPFEWNEKRIKTTYQQELRILGLELMEGLFEPPAGTTGRSVEQTMKKLQALQLRNQLTEQEEPEPPEEPEETPKKFIWVPPDQR